MPANEQSFFFCSFKFGNLYCSSIRVVQYNCCENGCYGVYKNHLLPKTGCELRVKFHT